METNADEPDSGAADGRDQEPQVAGQTRPPARPTRCDRRSGQPGANLDESSVRSQPARTAPEGRPAGLLPRAQRLKLMAAHEGCRDDLDLVGLSLSVQIGRLRGPAAAEEKSRLVNVRDKCQHLSQQISQLLSELEENRGFHFMQREDDLAKQVIDEKASKEAKELERIQNAVLQEKMQELQEMDKIIAELSHQQVELSDSINRKKKSLALMRKDRRESKEVHRDKLELLRKHLKEARAQVEALDYQKNLYREAQERQERWEEEAKQLLQEKERQYNNIGCRKTLNFDKLSELSRAIVEMQRVVMEEREEQERQAQLEELGKTASKVQAWWRGCMVRRGLGKYGKKEEPKKGKKQKGKK